MDRDSFLYGMSLPPGRRYVIAEAAGLYLINYGARAAEGLPGTCTVVFMPGGIDQDGKIALAADTSVSGCILRPLEAMTYVGLYLSAADNNTAVNLPAADGYHNAWLTVTRVGPYPATTDASPR